MRALDFVADKNSCSMAKCMSLGAFFSIIPHFLELTGILLHKCKIGTVTLILPLFFLYCKFQLLFTPAAYIQMHFRLDFFMEANNTNPDLTAHKGLPYVCIFIKVIRCGFLPKLIKYSAVSL